ncbi:hypothetical protein HCN44_002008 [Aphidius gifuensis]|uniref:Uncharacterized protein n=1 Tax=Aphidius gifuensis TaxID=684658 RepID=A0A834Y4H9_APHGI|nr:reticulocyte binding protein 2 homolog b-like [Aphidius gifuensis]KAF7996376.1 hypothetical protein HCN44_002008 [Aphidius gifuensis]
MNTGNMGKSSKDAQGDERSAQIKRLKSINSNIKNVETNVKQSDVPRPKAIAVQKQQQQQQQQQAKPKAVVLTKIGDGVKLSKLKIPTKVKSAVVTELPTNRVSQTSNKSEKRNSLLIDNTKKPTMKVQTTETTDLICQTKKKDIGKSKIKNDDNNQVSIEQEKETSQQQQQETTNGKTIDTKQEVQVINEVQIINEIQLEKEEKEEKKDTTNGISDNKKNNGTVPENVDKIKTDEKINTEEINKKNNTSKDDVNDDDIISLIDIPEDNVVTETTKSDEIVGSTTSESSPKKSDNNNKDQNNEIIIPESKINQDEPMTNDDDPSFISYDSAIMLKDVKIKLNDCLKDNNKLMDSVDENTSISESFKDLSFGRTLRTISGRSSLGRMKHVTIRQRQMTPNDSLFVNCSGMSTNQDDQMRFAFEYSDSIKSGTPIDRKRKIDTDIEPSAKKVKKDEGGIFNTSLEYLKKLRRPLQVSTPNNQEYKCNINDKMDITEDASKIDIDETAESKRWCILM